MDKIDVEVRSFLEEFNFSGADWNGSKLTCFSGETWITKGDVLTSTRKIWNMLEKKLLGSESKTWS